MSKHYSVSRVTILRTVTLHVIRVVVTLRKIGNQPRVEPQYNYNRTGKFSIRNGFSLIMPLITFPYNHPFVTAATLLFLGLGLRRALWLRFHPLRHAPRTPEPLIRVIDLISPPKDDPMKKLALYGQEPTYQPLVVVWGAIEGPVIVVNDADLIKEILISGQANYSGSNTMQRGRFSRGVVALLLGGHGILSLVDQVI